MLNSFPSDDSGFAESLGNSDLAQVTRATRVSIQGTRPLDIFCLFGDTSFEAPTSKENVSCV
jgi:hypothetical protein